MGEARRRREAGLEPRHKVELVSNASDPIEGDRLWFMAHPERTMRLRSSHRDEMPAGAVVFRPGDCVLVVVIGRGARLRFNVGKVRDELRAGSEADCERILLEFDISTDGAASRFLSFSRASTRGKDFRRRGKGFGAPGTIMVPVDKPLGWPVAPRATHRGNEALN